MNVMMRAVRGLGASIVALLGVTLSFLLIGVFGIPAAIITLVTFIGAAILIFQRQQIEPPEQ